MTEGNSVLPNATMLPSQQDVIVVSVNYRLGPLGFLTVRGFGDDGQGSGGMNGQHDQIVALQWVQIHIAAFGGDPGRVTIFGCSAGSLSICTLSASPLAAGLFQRAIMESGPCVGPWGPGTFEEGQAVAARVMASAGAHSLDELRALPPWALVWGQGQDQYDIDFPGYWVDGWVAPQHPSLQLRAGHWNPEAVLLGATSRDGVVGGTYVPAEDLPKNATTYLHVMARHFRPSNATGGVYGTVRLISGPVGTAAASAYPLSLFQAGGGAAGAYKAADGDYHVVCPTRELAGFVEQAGRPAYLYYFKHGPLMKRSCGGDESGATRGWANHGSEQAFVFGNGAQDKNCSFEAAEWNLAVKMQTFWASFAKTGAPGGGDSVAVAGLPHWPRYGASGASGARSAGGAGPAMRLETGDGLGVIESFGAGARESGEPVDCGFWQRVTGSYGLSRGSEGLAPGAPLVLYS